ncbi:hypothetical protein [Streptomyces sp. NPDC058664]|uniref:hypothetical protein n=1 Tax=unclassified Streptomyces TaxID=2593676 RepID=UPI00365C4567
MTTLEPLPPPLPTQYYSPGERLLHGKGIASAAGAGRAEDWIALDESVWVYAWRTDNRWSRQGSLRVGFHWFDDREISDWRRSPHWHEAGAGTGTAAGVCWSAPPTESEIAMGLCHDDPRIRLAALRLAEDGAMPASALPLVLIRCADTDTTVRELARTVLDRALAEADEDAVRALAPLALVLDLRRYGGWVRETVLARVGGTPARAVDELMASRRPEFRVAALRAGAAAGLIRPAEAYAIAERDGDTGVRVHAVRTAVRIAVRAARAGDGPALKDARDRFLTFLDACRDPSLRHAALADAQEAGLLRPEDSVRLALTHHDAVIRRRTVTALTAGPDGDPYLDRLLTARDAVVRAAAVGRLRPAGRGDELERHLTDAYARVRAAACREFRAAGGEPHTSYRSVCADPSAVTPGAVTGLAEQGEPDDVPLLRPLTRHPRGTVRARALAALRMLGALPGDEPAAFADDPHPSVRATALSSVRDSPGALRDLLSLPYEDVRAGALAHLSRRHGLDWPEALPFLDDPSPKVARAAADALLGTRHDIPLPLLLDMVAPGSPRARRAAGLALILRRGEPESLLVALRMFDDADGAVRAMARDRAVRGLWRRAEVTGPHADEIRALSERHAVELAHWLAEIRRRNTERRR